MKFAKSYWWKILCIVLLFYTVVRGFTGPVPALNILNESIRNVFFHVPMWFGMIILMTTSCIYAILYLRHGAVKYDIVSKEMANTGILFGLCGLSTGSIWALITWGDYWTADPKLNAAAIGVLIYLAYLVLRSSFVDGLQRARIGAVYNIFAFAALIPLLFILPRMAPNSLHPGNGGNPGFNAYDMNSDLRMVFYPAVIGWALLGTWIATVRIRLGLVKEALENKN